MLHLVEIHGAYPAWHVAAMTAEFDTVCPIPFSANQRKRQREPAVDGTLPTQLYPGY
jgi:hypothetical protein